jgi:ABC-type transporter Mla subunit MlaD
MKRETDIKDILALAKGEMDSTRAEELGSQAVEDDLAGLGRAAMCLEDIIDQVRRSFPDSVQRAREVDQWLDEPAKLVLEAEQVPEELPADLARAVAARRQGTLGERIKRSVEALTSLGGEAARDLATRISAASGPVAVPAIRKDATEVEDSEEETGSSVPDPDSDRK